jgi:hypothetical protein
MAPLSGLILLIQEGRFLLEDDSGRHRLFITAHSLPFNPEHLLRALSRERRCER